MSDNKTKHMYARKCVRCNIKFQTTKRNKWFCPDCHQYFVEAAKNIEPIYHEAKVLDSIKMPEDRFIPADNDWAVIADWLRSLPEGQLEAWDTRPKDKESISKQ